MDVTDGSRCLKVPALTVPEWVGMSALWMIAIGLMAWETWFGGPETAARWSLLVSAGAAAWTAAWIVVTTIGKCIPLVAEHVELRLQMREAVARVHRLDGERV